MKGGGGEEQEIPRVRVESREKYYLEFYMDSRARLLERSFAAF